MIAVQALQDESSHWYLVPNDEVGEFNRLSNIIIEYDSEDYDTIEEFEKLFSKYRTGGDLNNVQLYVDSVLALPKVSEDSEYVYQKLPDNFTHKYLTNIDEDSCIVVDYDESDDKYYEHFFQLNNMLKFSFRYYSIKKKVGNIYIMDDEGDNGWFENSWARTNILNDLMKEFDISNNMFNWNFNFKKYEC
jgi:hypothetical protein